MVVEIYNFCSTRLPTCFVMKGVNDDVGVLTSSMASVFACVLAVHHC